MKKILAFLMLIVFTKEIFPDNIKTLKTAGITALIIKNSLTWCDMDFFVGLGMLTEVYGDGVKLYIKNSKTGKAQTACRKIKFHSDIKDIKMEKKKIYCFNYKQAGEFLGIRSFFKYKGIKYFLVSHNMMSAHRMMLYKIRDDNIEEIKELKLSFIKVINGKLYGINMRYPMKIFILDDTFNIVKSIGLKKAQYLFTDFYEFGKELYFKKVRFKSKQPGFINEKGEMFFFKGQGNGKSLMEGYMRNQIVVGEDSDKIYITFRFPDSPEYPVFIYSKKGKCEKIIYGNIDEYMWIPRGNWFNHGLPKANMEIVSVNKIFCDLGKIFVIIHRNIGGKVGKTKRFVQVLSKKGRFLGEKEIKVLGFPVFYDKEEKIFYSIRKKDFSLRKWSLKIKYY
jgi:hypothetical protein